MKLTAAKKDPSEIPEVIEFEQAKAALLEFKGNTTHMMTPAQTFEYYDHLVEQYNQKLEAADKAVRGEEVSCGDWEQYSRYTKVDWEKLYNSLGRERFLRNGGKITKKTVFSGSQKDYELAVAQGTIPSEVNAACVGVEVKYHSPGKLVTI